jgi:hypothetical protein
MIAEMHSDLLTFGKTPELRSLLWEFQGFNGSLTTGTFYNPLADLSGNRYLESLHLRTAPQIN